MITTWHVRIIVYILQMLASKPSFYFYASQQVIIFFEYWDCQ